MQPLRTAKELVASHDAAVAAARQALMTVADEHLAKTWKLLAGGKVVNETPRGIVIRDTFMHLAHHRGQLTVYLRLSARRCRRSTDRRRTTRLFADNHWEHRLKSCPRRTPKSIFSVLD